MRPVGAAVPMSRTRFPRLGFLGLAVAGLVVGSVIWLLFDDRGADRRSEVSPPSPEDANGSALLLETADGPTESLDVAAVAPATPAARERVAAVEPAGNSGSYVIELVATDGSPVGNARARLFDEDSVRTSDAEGRLRFERPGVRGLVVADGFLPRSIEVPRGSATLELLPDPGLDVRAVWEDSGEPAIGARIRRTLSGDDVTLEVLESLAGAEVATDVEGRAHVRAVRIDGAVAALRFDHPQAATTWLQLGELLENRTDTPQLDVVLPRVGNGARFRVVDASGVPLADRIVRVSYSGGVEGKTDPDGRVTVPFAVRNVDPDEWDFVAVTVRLEAEDAWWYAGMFRTTDLAKEIELRVAPVRIHGKVVTSTPQSWQVAVAGLLGDADELAPRTWPRVDRLPWSDLAEDGGFDLTRGWQGLGSHVFLRARGSRVPLHAIAVPFDGSAIEIVPRATCRVSLDVMDAGAPDLAGAALVLLGPKDPSRSDPPREYARIEPLSSTQVSVLPQGRYDLRLSAGSASWSMPEIDVRGDEQRVEIPWPGLRRVRGTVRGTILGSVAGAEITVGDYEKRRWGSVFTDAHGRFEVDLPSDRRLRATATREPRPGQPRHVATRFEIVGIEPDQNELHFVQPEAEVRLVERPHQPLLADVPFTVHGPHRIDGSLVQYLSETLDAAGTATLLLEPDSYAIRRTLGEHALDLPITVVDGERREVVLDTSSVGPLALEVHFVLQPDLRLTAIARDASGRELRPWNRQAVAESPKRIVLPVAAGAYDVRVELHVSADERAPAIARWNGTIDALPGASEPMVVDLR